MRKRAAYEFSSISNGDIEQIARAIGDTEHGYTGSQITHLLQICGIEDPFPTTTKWRRIHNGLAERCNRDRSTNCVYQLILEAVKPVRGMENPRDYEYRRIKINEVLILHGIEVNSAGKFEQVKKAETIPEVKRRTSQLKKRLYDIHAHDYVLMCCKEELLAENCFHAVIEAAKGLLDRIREMTGLTLDSTNLIDTAFSNKMPRIAVNALQSESERNQQNGLREMLNGVTHMVRNVAAHELKIKWVIDENAAVDILSLISIMHRYFDACFVIPSAT